MKSKDLDTSAKYIHQEIVPRLHCLLWFIGILASGLDMRILPCSNPADKIFVGAVIIYVIFLVECLINLYDIACEHRKKQFQITLVYLIMKIIVTFIGVAVFSFLYFSSSEHHPFWGVLTITMMCWLKYISVHFYNNVPRHLAIMDLGTAKSSF